MAPPQPPLSWFLKISRRVKDKIIILILFQKKLSHEFGLENMTIRGLVFLEMQGREIILNRFSDSFLDLPLASKAIYLLLPKACAPRANLLSSSPSSQDRLIPLHPHPSSFSHTVWVLKTLGSDQLTELSFKPATHRQWQPKPHSQSPWQRPQSGIVSTVLGRSQKLTLSTNQGLIWRENEGSQAQSRLQAGGRKREFL